MSNSDAASDPGLWSATRQAAAIADRQLSSRELTQHLISRIERLDGEINAVVTRDFDAALAAAGAADEQLVATSTDNTQRLGRLHGVPITMKDALTTAGLRSTGGAVELTDNVPKTDAAVVATLRSHGVIILGKTNLPRWSGDNQSFNEIFGTTNNPWDLSRVPGGSSGGAAAAVAMGFTSFEIGTDIGGSIRFPASFNGVWGHKPSWGVIPTLGYLDHVDGGTTEADINVFGPLARSCDDLELLLDLLARREPPWPAQLPEPGFPELGFIGNAAGSGAAGSGASSTSKAKTGENLRVAAWLDDEFCPVDSEVLEVLDRAVTALEDSGVNVDRSARPAIDPTEAWELGLWLVRAAMTPGRKDDGPSHGEWLANHVRRTEIRHAWAEFFASYDAVIMPVSFVPPYEHCQTFPTSKRRLTCNGVERPYIEMTCWTILTGMAYLPATVPPLGLTATDKLPIGGQVVGAYGADRTTLAVARLLSEAVGEAPNAGYTPPPRAMG